MKIGLLEAGYPPEEFPNEPGYGEKMAKFLTDPNNPSQFEFVYYDLQKHQFPDSAHDCEGWMISGSKHGVYDNLPWMPPLRDFIKEVQAVKIPLFGICFGHQIIAETLGGEVRKSDKGWGIGIHDYQLTNTAPAWTKLAPSPYQGEGVGGEGDEHSQSFALNVFHQDQVITPPPSAHVIAQSDFCENAALLYGTNILSFQGHPEFENDYEKRLINLRSGSLLPDDVVATAMQRLESDNNNHNGAKVGAWARAFFLQHQSRAKHEFVSVDEAPLLPPT